MRFFVLIFVIPWLLIAYEANAAVVNSIKIQGAFQNDEKSIVSRLTIVPGKFFSDDEVNNSVKKLYSTGYFSDVKIQLLNSDLIVTVVEKKVINQLIFNGNEHIKENILQNMVLSRPTGLYDKYLVDTDIAQIKAVYAQQGYSNVSVDSQVRPVSPGRIDLSYSIKENIRERINKISFMGNKAYSSSRLERVIFARRSNVFSRFFGGFDLPNDERLALDKNLLRKFYDDRGYAGARIDSQEVLHDKQNNGYHLIFKIEEGGIYRIGNVVVRSSLKGIDGDELVRFVQSRSGDLYSTRNIEKTVKRISEYFYSMGRSSVGVTSQINRDFKKNTVDVEYFIDQKDPLYIDRIEIKGNYSLRDYLIRRELNFNEGDSVNEDMFEQAKLRLIRTGYFSSVNFSKSPTNMPNHIILSIEVGEKKADELNLSLSVANSGTLSTSDGGFGITRRDFLGRGLIFSANASFPLDLSSVQGGIGIVDPYFLGSRVSAGFNFYKSQTRELFVQEDNRGSSLSFGIPIVENLSTKFSYNYNQRTSKTTNNVASSAAYQDLINRENYITSYASQDIIYNTLDDVDMPRDGLWWRIGHGLAGLGGDSKYYKLTGSMKYCHLLEDNLDVVGSISINSGYLVPTEKSGVSIVDQFKIGPKIIRGFEEDGISLRLMGGESIGGKAYFAAKAEVDFPLPIFPQRLGVRSSFFVDSATLYGNAIAIPAQGLPLQGENDSSLRLSVGANVGMKMPLVGKIGVYYAFPLLKESEDKTKALGFYIGW
ncbi:outer membrane protein assembly factor BamA [Candidatus Liberibacter sp.]|uniref:outer membrane protein assembly factor BamA n=1 Tax=Candidatus Liberibacter sp. TaxID=34022 RepID=UPI0015F6E84C|nr:outer membrane protein assembly factor BamA [Candidatus Liberibacter sp.]MBA5724457.1 outer membrane protein assembly factor BamA [Candidatus Liberibacter sp.]